MKLPDHVDRLRNLIEGTFDKHFARLGLLSSKTMDLEKLPESLRPKRLRFEDMLSNHEGETGDYSAAREKLIDELSFTLFNRLAAIKVMEAANMFPPILTKMSEYGCRSLGHKQWLDESPYRRELELDGIREYLKDAFDELGEQLPLYHKSYPYAILPDTTSLNEIVDTLNAIEKDSDVVSNIWHSDDVLGWLYESYNNKKKQEHKESKAKTEYHKVSLQSQVYTPRWVVQFLVENSLGKFYLEMYPESEIKNRFKIAHATDEATREHKALHDIKLIDPACGSGNFLLYAFDFFYELYLDQIENYNAEYDKKDIPQLIIENNLHGIDLDDRAVQLAQLGLYIKARKKNSNLSNIHFNVVSSDFFLPEYEEVKSIFTDGINSLSPYQQEIIEDVWGDLQQAYKFGSLIRLDEKIKASLNREIAKLSTEQRSLFTDEELGIPKKPIQRELFIEHHIKEEKQFAADFFAKLKHAVEQHAQTQGNTFLSSKTRDAITFLELLSTEYDVATANPPYTDSSDFGKDLKAFIDNNYKKPHKFHTNLYATFIKRCYDLIANKGKIAMIHPPTFMYIKSFEGVREFILNKTYIHLFIEWGYLGIFHPSARVDSALYILEKNIKINKYSTFIKLNDLYETKRYDALVDIFNKFLNHESHDFLFSLEQSKLRIIESSPFIYWISDEFREKFRLSPLSKNANVISGIKTGNNNGAIRFWWEVNPHHIYTGLNAISWVVYSKGGEYRKWSGNNWLCINYKDDACFIKRQNSYNLISDTYWKNIGLSYSGSGSKGISFRIKPSNYLFDMGASGVFPQKDIIYSTLAILNSKTAFYITNCLNPTVNKQPNDVKRIPLPSIPSDTNKIISSLSLKNIEIRDQIDRFSIVERQYNTAPLALSDIKQSFISSVKHYFNLENYLICQLLIQESIIDEKIFDLYELNVDDRKMVLLSEGVMLGKLPLDIDAAQNYLSERNTHNKFPLDDIYEYITQIPIKKFTDEERAAIEGELVKLYQSNNDLEDFCIRHQVNPINVWYWFKESSVIPPQRMRTLAMEFLVDMVREILMEDDDGIIPLVPNAGEKPLANRIEEKFYEKGYSPAQYSSFDTVLGTSIPEYIQKSFFKELSDHLNLFMYLPKTPFIWHLSSGPVQGFDCYIIIYKWSRDKLMRLQSVYVEHREQVLINRQSDLAGSENAKDQSEHALITRQLREIESFKKKIDELLAEGYNPILDDGVGKNIAPLQKKKMLTYDVLNAGQLKKYLNADW